MTPGWQRYALGEARITTVLDGPRTAMAPFRPSATTSEEAVAALMRRTFLPETRFVNGFSPALVELDDNLILFDTGFGESGKENGLRQAGRAHGRCRLRAGRRDHRRPHPSSSAITFSV